jgi:thiol-disulfide isomerase/thioredoxin
LNVKHLVLLLLAGLSFSLVYFFAPETRDTSALTSLAGVTISNMSGQEFKLASQFTEKPVLFVFWSVTCGTCIEEIPFITALYEELADKMTIIGVHPAGFPQNRIQNFLRRYKKNIPYTLVIDSEGELTKAYDITVLPRLVMVNRQGKILYDHLGYTYDNEGEVKNAIVSNL